MPTIKKRVALSLPDELDALLTELNDLTGQPKSSIIVQILEDSIPMLRMTIEVLRHSKQGNRESMVSAMAELLKSAGFQLDEIQHEFFQFKKGGK
jgi:predicted DNA-binding protein